MNKLLIGYTWGLLLFLMSMSNPVLAQLKILDDGDATSIDDGDTIVVCQGSRNILDAPVTLGLSHSWLFNGAASNLLGSLFSVATRTFNTVGVFNANVSNRVTYNYDYTIIVVERPSPIPPMDTTICVAQPLSLITGNVRSSDSIHWEAPVRMTNRSDSAWAFTPWTPGAYQYDAYAYTRKEIGNITYALCEEDYDVEATVVANGSLLNIMATPSTPCLYDSLTLRVNLMNTQTYNIEWALDSLFHQVFRYRTGVTGQNRDTVVIRQQQATEYFVRVTNLGNMSCPAIGRVWVPMSTNPPAAPATITANRDTFYLGEMIQLQNLNPQQGGTIWQTPVNGSATGTNYTSVFNNASQSGFYKALNRGLPGECPSEPDSVHITVLPFYPANISVSAPTAICAGNMATLGINITNGVPPFDVYLATDPGFTNVINSSLGVSNFITFQVSPTATTVYYIKTVDSNRIDQTTSKTISVNPAVSVSIDSLLYIPCPNEWFQLHATATGGTPGFSFAWSRNASFSPVFWNSTAQLSDRRPIVVGGHDYYVRIMDSNGCTATATRNINVVRYPVRPDVQGDSILCAGEVLELTPNTPLSAPIPNYTWISPAGDPLSTYGLTIHADSSDYQNGRWQMAAQGSAVCHDTFSIVVKIDSVPNVSIGGVPGNAICPGNVSLWVAGTSPNVRSYSWLNRMGDLLGTGASLSLLNLDQDSTIFLQVETTTDSCVYLVDSVEIDVLPTAPTPNLYALTNTVYVDDTLDLLNLNPFGYGTRFNRPPPPSIPPPPAPGPDSLQVIFHNVNQSGWYTAVNRGVMGTWCDSPADSIEITVFPTLLVGVGALPLYPTCSGGQVPLSAIGTGGVMPYTYDWSTDSFATILHSGNNYNASPDTTTRYYLRVNDVNGRSAAIAFTLVVHPQMSATITSNPTPACSNVPFDLTINMTQGVPPYSYIWSRSSAVFVPQSGGATFRDTTLNTTTYYVQVRDSNNCDTVFIYQQIIAPTASITGINGDSVICQGDDLNLTGITAVAGTTMQWIAPTGGVYSSNSISISPTSPHYRSGIWRLRARYSGFCDTMVFLRVHIDSVPPAPLANLSSTLRVCRRGSIVLGVRPSLLPLPNVSLTNTVWRDSLGALLGTGPTLNVQNILGDTTIYLEFTTNQGCIFTVDSARIRMLSGPPPPMQIADSTQCEGDTLRFSSGLPLPGLMHYWVSPNGTVDSTSGNRFDVNNVTTADSGQYLLYVRGPVLGCSSDTSVLNVAVNVLPNKPLILSTDTLFCSNKPIELIGSTSGCTNSYWSPIPNLTIGTNTNPDTLRIPLGGPSYSNGVWRLYCENNITTCVQASDPVNVRIVTPPVGRPRFARLDTACVGESVTIRRDVPGPPALRWSVDILGQNTVFGVDSLVFTNLEHDTVVYAQFWDPATGCLSLPAVDTLEVYPTIPTPQLPPTLDLCQGDSLILATVPRPATAYQWFLVGTSFTRSGSSITIATANPIAYQSGVFGVYAMDSTNSCVSDTAYVQVTIHAVPPELELPRFSLVCPWDSLILAPTNGSAACDSVQWHSWFSPRNGATSASLTIAPGDSQRLNLGLWVTECVDTNTGCSSFSNWSFVFTPNYLNNVSPVALPSTACVGQDVSIYVDPTTFVYDTLFTYEWRDNNGIFIDTGYYTAIAPDVQVGDSIFLFIIGPSGCSSDPIPVPLTIVPPDSAPSIIGDAFYCEGQPITLSTLDTRTPYYWNSSNGWSDVTSLGATTVTSSATVFDSGLYMLSVLDSNGCVTLADTMRIQVVQLPDTLFIDSFWVCDGQPMVWSATGASCGQYIWTSSIGNTFITTTNMLTITDSMADYSNTVTWTVTCLDTLTNCSSVSLPSVPARIVQPPSITTLSLVNLNGSVCFGGTASVSVGLPATSIIDVAWYADPFEGQLVGRGTTVQWSNLRSDTTIYVVVTDTTTGCRTMDSLQIMVNAPVPLPIITGDSILCVNEVLSLSTTGAYSSYSWTGPNGFSNLNPSWSLIADTVLYDGLYTVQVTDSLGCLSAPRSRRVTVRPTPRLQAVTLTPNVCEGDALTLSAVPFNASYNYEWYRLRTGVSTWVGTNATLTFNPVLRADAGRYYVKAEFNGCFGYSDTIQIDIDTPSTVYLASLGPDTTLCGIDSIFLRALGGFPTSITGTWTSSDVSVTLQPRSRFAALGSNLPQGTTTFYWSLSSGSCVDYSIDSVSITYLLPSTVRADAGPDQFLCDEPSALLGALGTTASGRWRQLPSQAAQGVSINDAADPNTGVQGLQPNNSYLFIWDLAAGLCRSASADTVAIYIDTIPNGVAQAGPDQQICDVNSAFLSAVLPTNTVGMWTTNSDAFIQLPDSAETGVFDLRPGTTAFVWSLSSGACVNYSSDTVLVFFGQGLINARPDFVYAPTGTALVPIFDNDQLPPVWTYTLEQVPNEVQVIELGNGVLEVNVDEGVVQTQFIYEICDSVCPNNCDTALVFITVDVAQACAIPNIFTPNGDGVNDFFEIPCILAQTSLRIQIFNRWGDAVYETDQYNNKWDGTHQGKPLPDGTYFYVLFREGQEGQQGSIEIKR